MKYFIIYAVGFFLTFGYLASTADNCYKSVIRTDAECRGWYALPRAYFWPVYWPMVGSWAAFDLVLGVTKGPYD